MRQSVLVAAATCALALFVVCAVVSQSSRSSNDIESLLSAAVNTRARLSSGEDHESSGDITSDEHVPVLLTSTPPKRTAQASLLRGKDEHPSLAGVGNSVFFNADDSFNFGRMNVQTSVGFTIVSSFAFGSHVGNWERIFDFGPFWGGSGQGMGIVMAREGGSNNLVTHLYPGGGRPMMDTRMVDKIRPNVQMTTASTYQCSPALVRFIRIQGRHQGMQIGFVSAQTADGTNVAFGKRAYASGTLPGTDPRRAVTGPASTRNHPNYWHGVNTFDWWEVDLGQEYAITKVVIYNRAECCQYRMQDALLTTMDSGRSVINSVNLNANAVQEYTFSPFLGVYRFYIKDGSHNNQLWLVNELRQAGVPCASATFDNTYVARSNWGHDALLTGRIGYFSFSNGVQSFGALANLAAAIEENPQNAPGNWLKSNPVMVPGYTAFDDTFVNPQVTRPTIAGPGPLYTRPVIFNRNNQNFLDFGRTVANPNDGITFIASFAFTGNQPGNWERIFDFGSGPDTQNFVLARQGAGNDLVMLGNVGGPTTTHIVARNVIRPGRLLVAVCTHLHGVSKLYLNGELVGQSSARPSPGLKTYSQSFLGKSNWGHDTFLNGQIFYFQQWNGVVSEAHQRVIFRNLNRAANSVIGYIPASAPVPAPAPPVDLRDAALPCGNDLLASEGLTNDEGTARLIMQGDGNLVLYNKNGKALWASGTSGNPGDRLEVQTDGNLVVYQGSSVKWASNSNVHPQGCELVVQDDCNLVLYKSNDHGVYGADNALGNFSPRDAIWNSRTHGRCNEPLFN